MAKERLSKAERRLRLSNAAHSRLQKRARNKGEAGQQLSLYHGACILRQEKAGRVFTKAERKKVFDDVISSFF